MGGRQRSEGRFHPRHQSSPRRQRVHCHLMASNNQNPDSAAPLFFSSAICFLTSGIFGLVGYYQRQQLQALRNATIIRVRLVFYPHNLVVFIP